MYGSWCDGGDGWDGGFGLVVEVNTLKERWTLEMKVVKFDDSKHVELHHARGVPTHPAWRFWIEYVTCRKRVETKTQEDNSENALIDLSFKSTLDIGTPWRWSISY